jgi:hypothetical protein
MICGLPQCERNEHSWKAVVVRSFPKPRMFVKKSFYDVPNGWFNFVPICLQTSLFQTLTKLNLFNDICKGTGIKIFYNVKMFAKGGIK